jgi:hypothetical protein
VLVEVSHLPQLFVRAQELFALPHGKLPQRCNVTARCGRTMSHPKISISECELFSQKKFKISKGFSLFSIEMILFEFIFDFK